MFNLSGVHGRMICVLMFVGSAALAQESRGTIGGRVLDTENVEVPHARVIISNIETGIDTILASNDSGAYVAPLLIPGNYRISVEHPGFKKTTRGGITLSINDNL